jgi:hypothetical protein
VGRSRAARAGRRARRGSVPAADRSRQGRGRPAPHILRSARSARRQAAKAPTAGPPAGPAGGRNDRRGWQSGLAEPGGRPSPSARRLTGGSSGQRLRTAPRGGPGLRRRGRGYGAARCRTARPARRSAPTPAQASLRCRGAPATAVNAPAAGMRVPSAPLVRGPNADRAGWSRRRRRRRCMPNSRTMVVDQVSPGRALSACSTAARRLRRATLERRRLRPQTNPGAGRHDS